MQPKPEDKKDAPVPDVLKAEAPIVVQVSDDAKPVLAKMREAYAKLAGLQMAGTWRAEWDVDGREGRGVGRLHQQLRRPQQVPPRDEGRAAVRLHR